MKTQTKPFEGFPRSNQSVQEIRKPWFHSSVMAQTEYWTFFTQFSTFQERKLKRELSSKFS